MDPITMSLIAGTALTAAGAGGKALGGFLGKSAEESAAAEQRKAIERSLAQTRQSFDYASRLEAQQSAAALAQAQLSSSRALQVAQQQSQQQLYDIFSSPAMNAYAGYLGDLFTKGIPDVAANEYAGRLRAAQAARGTAFGGAAETQEAILLTTLAEQGRQALLPQLQQFALLPNTLRQQNVQANLQAQQASQNIGFQPFGASLQGRQLASQVAGQQLSLGSMALSGAYNSPFAATPPLGAYLGTAFGDVAGQLGGAILGGGLFGTKG